jgi:hypothetical protein
MLPILLLLFGLFDHLFEFLFSDSLDLLALKELELNRDSDIELALAILGHHIFLVFKARLDERLEFLEVFFLQFLLTLGIILREALLCHG